MIDSLSPLFTDRNTRLAAFPDEQRLAFEALEKSSGDPMFADRQLASIWMSKRTGLPQEEVLKNFDGLASRYFGEGATATQAYDRISELYKVRLEAAPAQNEKGAPQATESPFSVSGTVIFKDVAGSLLGGASRTGYDTLGGFYANLSAATGVTLKRPQDDAEYQALDRRRVLADDPTAFDFRDESMGFGGGADDAALAADATAMQSIRDRVQAENMAALDAAAGTFMQSYSDDARKIADTMYNLSKGSIDAFGVRQEFQDTAVGNLVANAGSLPVTALMGAMGPIIGPGLTFSSIYGQVEQERMKVEGENYDSTGAWLQNLASAGPQAAMEYAFGVERIMGKIVKMTPKVGGKIMFGDAARLMGKTGLRSGIEEGLTEPTQGFWNDWIASLSYDEQRELFTEDKVKERLLESVSAFALGFLFGGGVQGVQILDRNKAVTKSERFLLTREGKPIDGPDFAALRTVKTDEELRAMAPNGLGDMLVGAANGNVDMQIAYRQETLRQAFVDTDGMTVQGLTIGKIGDEVGVRDGSGRIIVIDQTDPKQVDFLKQLQAEAAARDATTQATIDEMKRRFGNLLEVDKRELPAKLSDLRKKGLITKEQEADALAAAVYINEALSEDATDALVMGSARLTQSETDNILRMVINVAQGADPTVAVEELAEAWKKKGIVEGKLDELKLRGYREQWHKDNNESDPAADGRVTPERADTEWFSKRVIDYALANRKTELPGGWGDWLRTLGERLRKLLQGATRMKKMLREGKIAPELEGWFREALGAEQGRLSDGATFSLSETNNQNVGDTTFSLANVVTAADIKQNMSIINPTRTKGRVKVYDLATALDELAKKEGYHRPANDYSAEAIMQAAKAMAVDLADMLSRDDSGIGWYDRKVRSALELLARVHPEIATDEEAQLRFKVLLAAISQGNSVDINFEVAEKAYREFKETGKLPTWPYPGKSDAPIRNNITKLFTLIEARGAAEVMATMKMRMTVKEWNARGYKVEGELVDTVVTGAMAIMGSKIGSFFGNMNGDYTTFTADLWFSRTWNRTFGNMRGKLDPNVLDEMRETVKATKETSKLLGYKKADLLKDDDLLMEFTKEKADAYKKGNYKDKTPLNIKANTAAKKIAGAMNDDPRGGTERAAMRESINQAIDLLEQQGFPRLTVADAQAILWYGEKDLFSLFKAVSKKGEKVDYEVAAQNVVGSYGLDNRVSDQFLRLEPPAISRGNRSGRSQSVQPTETNRSRASDGVGQSFNLSPTDPTLWDSGIQEITSAKTSINQSKMPATFSRVEFAPGTRNADIGGGSFDNATEYLKDKDVENVIFDPFNRAKEANDAAVAKIRDGQSDTATVNNVLNVIQEPDQRSRVIAQAANAIKPDGTAYFLIYEGNADGAGKKTKIGTWQENRKAADYIDEIGKYFSDVKKAGNLLVATGPQTDTSFNLASTDPAPVFYSRLIRTVEQSTQGKASGAQWKATIKNSKLGVNQGEFALVGVQDLEDGKTYTKQEVLDYLRANEVKVEDVTLGGESKEDFRELTEYDSQSDQVYKTDGSNEMANVVIRRYSDRKDEIGAIVEYETEADSPQGEGFDERFVVESSKNNYSKGFSTLQDAEEYLARDVEQPKGEPTQFESQVLPGAIEGSYREVLLTVPAGKTRRQKLDEISEKFRKFLAGRSISQLSEADRAINSGFEEEHNKIADNTYEAGNWRDGHSQYDGIPDPIVRLRYNERVMADGKRMLFLEEVQPPKTETGDFQKMPELFQKNWREIGFKWALRKAVDGGFDVLGWTTGKQQAARYDLSKQIDRLDYRKEPDGKFYVRAVKGSLPVIEKYVPADELENTVGKEMAKKVVNGEGESQAQYGGTFTSLKGLDLEVGGDGLKKLYDSDFRNVVNGLAPVKKAGQKVGRVTLPIEAEGDPMNGEEAGSGEVEVNALKLTDAIRESAMSGQTTFSLAYLGDHTAPDKGSGAPLNNLVGIYPADVYSYNGLRFYGTGNDALDRQAYDVVLQYRDKPNRLVAIYRAVPKTVKDGINVGDWVTTVQSYATAHGRQSLNNDFRIIKKVVYARDIFTAGDSWLEWGYDPQPFDKEVDKARREQRNADNQSTSATEDPTFALTPTPASRAFNAIYAKQAAMFPYPYHRISSTPTQAQISLGGHEAGKLGRALLPISERLRFIADRAGSRTGILYRTRRYYSEKGTNLKRYSDEVTPLMRGLAKMSTQDMKIFKAAASNQDALQRDNVIAKYGLQNEWASYEAARDSLRAEMIAAGMDVGDIGEYFPRWVKDVTGLRKSFGMDASDQPLVQAVIDAEEKAGRALTDEEVNAVLDGAIRGVRSGVIGGAAPSNTKQRKIRTIADTQLDFYADPNHALSRWLNQSTEAIARYRFFGKAAQPSTTFPSQIDLDVSIGSILREEVASGNLTATAQMEVKAMLNGLFAYHGKTNAYLRGFIDLSYWATMGKLSSSLAQATDVMISVYEAGPWNTAMAVSEAMWRNAKNLPGIGNSKTMSEAFANFTKGKNWLTREELGVDRIMDEFSNQSFTTAALNQVFTATGLNFMDGIGKDTLLNAKFQQLAKQAKRSAGLSASNQKMIEQIFGKAKARQVIADFRAGTKNADTIFTVYNVLADWQPISLLEYPEVYAKNPNGRVLYMLKSYSIKMLAAYRREGFMKMWYGSPEQKIEGARNLAYLLAMLFMAGVSKDWLVDFILERDPQLEDLVCDNVFKLAQVSRYALWQQRNRAADMGVYGGVAAAAQMAQNTRQIITDLIAPPTVLIERPAKDVAAWAKAKAEYEPWTFWQSESVQFIPVAGEFIYWTGPTGQAKIERRRKLRDE